MRKRRRDKEKASQAGCGYGFEFGCGAAAGLGNERAGLGADVSAWGLEKRRRQSLGDGVR